jgi:DHA2 family multidrug resistance protein
MAVVLAPAIGPTLGGLITDHYSWRWIFFINVPVGLTSLLLTNRVVSDPPHLRQMRTGGVDGLGLGLIALGLGCLEVVLDKGQEEDWFHSRFIVVFSIVAAVALVWFVLHERRHPNPVVDVRMFRDRNFAASNLMMLTLGAALFGSTVLLPQFLQVMMGYTAQQAGMALSPGGFAVILLLPLVGRLVSRVDPRFLIAFGFTVLSTSMFYMTRHLYEGIDFRTAVELRVFQSVGLAFLFVPINTLVYAGVPPQKNNAVSGIVNLSRNMGGDIGIAFVTTYIARRSQFHQSTLSAHTSSFDQPFATQLAAISRALERTGASTAEAARRALAILYRQLVGQSVTLAYLDAIKVLAIAAALMVPLLFLTRPPRPGAAMAGH